MSMTKCVVCGESKLTSHHLDNGDGWCMACDLKGRLWAARMARNPENVFDVSNSAPSRSIGIVAGIAAINRVMTDPKPLIVTGNGGAANAG